MLNKFVCKECKIEMKKVDPKDITYDVSISGSSDFRTDVSSPAPSSPPTYPSNHEKESKPIVINTYKCPRCEKEKQIIE